MSEEIYSSLIKQIVALEESNRLFEIENAKLKAENEEKEKFANHLLSEIEFLKAIVGNGIPKTTMLTESTQIKQSIPETLDLDKKPKLSIYEFDGLLDNYEINRNEETLLQLFDKYPDKHKLILSAIRFSLPDDIQNLAEKYQFEQDLSIILKTNKIIEKLKATNRFKNYGLLELVDKYKKAFDSDKKNAIYRYVKHALLLYPLTYDKDFLDKIPNHQLEGFNENINRIRNEIFGTFKAKRAKKIKEPKKPKEPRVPKILKENRKERVCLDYENGSIDNIISEVRSKESKYVRRYAESALKGLKKAKRATNDIEKFVNEINKYLTKKITI